MTLGPTDDELCERAAQVLGVPNERCTPATTLSELSADSLTQVELAIDVQDEYEVIFGFDDFVSLSTLADLAELIRSRKDTQWAPFPAGHA